MKKIFLVLIAATTLLSLLSGCCMPTKQETTATAEHIGADITLDAFFDNNFGDILQSIFFIIISRQAPCYNPFLKSCFIKLYKKLLNP